MLEYEKRRDKISELHSMPQKGKIGNKKQQSFE